MGRGVVDLFDEAIASIDRHDSFSFDIETTGLDPLTTELLVLSLATEEDAWAIPFAGPVSHLSWRDSEMSRRIAHVFSDPNKLGISWNGAFDVKHLTYRRFSIKTRDADGLIATWLLDEMLARSKQLGLKKQAKQVLGVDMAELEDTRLLGGIVDDVALDYARDDAKYTFIIYQDHLKSRLEEEGLIKVFERVCMPMIRVIVEMELNGTLIDIEQLKRVAADLTQKNDAVLQELREISGNSKFNPGSSKQLSALLFGSSSPFRIPVKKGHEWKIKSKQWSTDKRSLRRYKSDHPIFDKLTDYRKSKKLLTTYAVPLQRRAASSLDGRVRSSFRQTGTVCVRHDTLVPTGSGLLEIGKLLPACESVEPFRCVVATRSGTAATSHVVHNGTRKTRRIRTRLGFELEATLNHPIWVNPDLGSCGRMSSSRHEELLQRGRWTELSDVKVGDFVQLRRSTEMFGDQVALPAFARSSARRRNDIAFPDKMTPDLALFIGAYMASGSIQGLHRGGSGIRINHSDDRAKQIVVGAIERSLGISPNVHPDRIDIFSADLAEFCRQVFQFETGAHLKIVPDCVKVAPRDCVVAFLSGLFLDSSTIPRIFGVRYLSASLNLARWVHLQLLNCGVVSSFCEVQDLGTSHHSGPTGQQTYLYAVTCKGQNTRRLVQLIRPLRKALADYFASPPSEPTRKNYTERDDVVWLKVRSVDDSTADVWDLTVPGDACFVSNGIVSHNTGRLCLAGGTTIVGSGPNESTVETPIERIKPGDYVYCYDDRADLRLREVVWAGKTGHRPVLRLHWKAHDQLAGSLDMTPEHPVLLTDGTYVRARDLAPGSQLMAFPRSHLAGTTREIVAIEDRGISCDVYDLSIDEVPNFIAGDICVHNSSNTPNFQNISTKGGIREAFVAPEGKLICVADYNQLELRMGGFLAYRTFGKSNIVEKYRQGLDLHEATRRTYDALGIDRFNEAAVGATEARRNAKVCVTGDTLLLTDHGLVRIDDIVDAVAPGELRPVPYPISVASDTEVLPIEGIYYGGIKPVLRITTEHGLRLDCTYEHPCFRIIDGEVKQVPAGELKVGECLLMRVGTHLYGNEDRIPEAPSAERAEDGPNYQPWEPPQKLTPEICRLFGYLISEGSWNSCGGSYCIKVTLKTDDHDIADDVSRCWKAVFGYRGKIHTVGDLINFSMSSKDAIHWIIGLGFGVGSGSLRIPQVILSSSRTLQREFLIAMFSGDGYASSRHRIVGITLKSEDCIRKLQLMLLNMDILAWISSEERVNYGTYWCLKIYGAEAEKFIDEVGFSSRRKMQTLSRVEFSRSTRYLDGVAPILVGLKSSCSGIARNKVTECLTHNIDFGNTRLSLLPDLILPDTLRWAKQGGMWSTRIKSIETVGNSRVFDIVEPKKKVFITNGLVTLDCNFGYYYGRSADAFARDNPEIAYSESVRLRELFLVKLYPEITAMHDHCVKELVENGFGRTITGRKRRFKYCYGRNPEDVWWEGWVLWNALVQGCQHPDGLILTDVGYVPLRCVAPGTHVLLTEHGPIRDYVIHDVGSKVAFAVETGAGDGVFSGDHRFGTYAGGTERYLPLRSLSVGDWLIGATPTLIAGKEADRKCSPDEAYLLGTLIGNGSYSAKGNNISLCAGGADQGYIDVLASLLSSVWGCTPKWSRCMGSKGYTKRVAIDRRELRDRVLSLGLARVSGAQKIIPEWLFTAPIDIRVGFLQGLMDTDGGVSSNRACFASISENVGRGVWRLLESLGIPARYRGRNYVKRVYVDPLYTSVYRRVVGFRHPRKAASLDRVPDSRGRLPASLVSDVGNFILSQPETRELIETHVDTSSARWARMSVVRRRRLYNNGEYRLLHRLRNGSGTRASCMEMLMKLPDSSERNHFLSLCAHRWVKLTAIRAAGKIRMMDIESREPNKSYIGAGVAQHNSSQDLIQIAMRDVFSDISAGRAGCEVQSEDKMLTFPKDVWDEIRILIQVHDELVVETPDSVAEDVAQWLSYRMGHALAGQVVEFPAEAGLGKNWAVAKDAPKKEKPVPVADVDTKADDEDDDDDDGEDEPDMSG